MKAAGREGAKRTPKSTRPPTQRKTVRKTRRNNQTPGVLRQSVLDALAVKSLDARSGERLADLLVAFATSRNLAERADSFLELAWWVLSSQDPPLPGSAPSTDRAERFRVFVELLEESSAVRRRFLGSLEALLAESDATNLFGEAGLPSRRSFVAEAAERITAKIVPRPRDDDDLAMLLRRLVAHRSMPDLLPRVPRGLFRRLVAVLTADGAARWDPLRRAFADGFRLLTTAVQEQGLHSRLRDLTTTVAVAGSPFYEIGRSGERLLAAWQRGRGVQQALSSWRRDAAACRSEMAVIHRQIDAEGVNLDTVFGLERIDRALSRLEIMADIISAPSPDAAAESIQQLLVRVAYFTYQDRRLRHLVDWNLKLLNRKIVERSGKTGEHYIATSRKEYWGIWAASAGGGLVTVFTAAGKLAITGAGLALFQEGFAVGLNYALSFLVLQAFGLMLATKQPAMTAATLANIVRDRKGSMRYEQLLEFASRITFSQLASAIANVTVVFGGAYLFDFLWRLAAGSPFLAYEQARYVFETLSPINSGTIFYAAVTGVILWLASLIGGWFDNFTAYNRIPAGIADHPLGAVFGRSRMERAGAFLARNAAGWGTNISLGFLLGFTPAIGHFLGVPLDVRHVTLSSGMLALAAAALDHRLFQWGWFILGATGILTMFVLNLSVSFLLSLGNAARAYGYSGGQVLEFLRRLARNFIRRPLTFILPPKKWVVPAGPPADKDAGPV